ncbi:YfiT family bacillithiol transferase [Polaribacter gochangensis]|uniref:YfiT family bacillithiol transferase n=1 Tax=Polaribacter gochangensis TaxID=3252903 RepID=UPI003904B2CA
MEHLKYPIGHVHIPENISAKDIENWISEIEEFPSKLENLVKSLSQEQLNTPYRNGGWTIRQTIHHCGDSHVNSYIRFKWTLTENQPTIKAYFEDRWAELFDAKDAPIELSLLFIKALHAKWVYLLKGLTEDDLNNVFIHPESGDSVSLKKNIAIYAWHCNHHFAHIKNVLIRNKWV